MVHNNKVLTVSYGTFSCTLEGFEDSFDTMKAIAEYFRDLAADDRYFGAEPPQPDAEMLARIAQREVARQVEAHTSDQGIHLRAATALAPDAAAVAPTAGPATTSEAASQDAPAPAKADAPAPISEPVSETVSEPVAQTDALASIAPAAPDVPSNATTSVPDIAPPVVADTALAPELEDTEDTFGDVELFETAAAEEAAVEENQQVAAEVDFFDVSNEAPGVDTAPTEGSDAEAAAWGVDAALVDASTASEEDHIILPEAETEPTPVSESIAAKLQRIRAVVAKTPPREEEFSEDQHAEGFNVANTYLEDAVKELEAVGDESADTSDAADLIEDTIEADVSDILDQLEAEAASDAPETSGAAQDDDLDATLRAVTEATKAEAERTAAPLAEDAIDRVAQEAPTEEVAPADAPTPEATEDAADTADAEPQPNAKAEPAAEAATAKVEPRRVRGRVIRVRRAAVSNTLVDATAEDVTPEAAQPAAEPVTEAEPPRPEPTQDIAPAPQSAARDEKPDAQSSLSDADEADLMAELAAVEADLMASGRPAEAPSAAQQEDAQDNGPADTEGFAQETVRLEEQEDFDTAENMPASPTAASLLQRSPGALEGDLSRLMAEADDKLEQADAASSRETYNQLRAAVAAAQAEGSTLDDSAEKDAQAQAYRQDLDSVVRPRRPLGDDAKGAAGRGAPLKLVAEQRIDPDPTPEPIGQVSEPEEVAATLQTAPARAGQPVRPRRVSSAMLSRKSTSGAEGLDTGFADFVRQQGAVELGELLEAAAAYLTKVEGRDQFTRPQLLGKVRGLDDQSSLTREDSLRAFGQLLRDGKLDKASNGRFTTNSQTGFQPGDRAAG